MKILARPSVFMLAVVVSALTCPTARSQTVLYTFDGVEPNDRSGKVSGAGDVNMDCVPDFIMGARFHDGPNGVDSGSATVFSGADGSVLHTFFGDAANDEFGGRFQPPRGAGDVNADGFDDVIVGARFNDTNGPNAGMARVFSGVNGAILYTFHGTSTADQFGTAVSGAGDVNMDGYDDVIVGAPLDDNNGNVSGSATVFSGMDGSVLWAQDGDNAGDFFGWSVSGAGDVNMDGYADVIVGASHNFIPAGDYARVLSGFDGSTLFTFPGGSAGDTFGFSVSGAGDVSGDGVPDLIVGAPGGNTNGTLSGMARVFSGVDGAILYTFFGDRAFTELGLSVSGAGDVNGDGVPDLIVGIPLYDNNGTNSGGARVFSGVDGSVLYTYEGDVGTTAGPPFGTGDHFGHAVSGAGDVDGDGLDDVIVGAQFDDNNGPNTGSAQVFLSRGELGTSYCGPAVANSTGEPGVIRALGLVGANANELFLTADQLPIDQFGYFLVSQTQGFFMPPGSQGYICLGGNIGRYNGHVRPGPTFSLQIDLTSIPVNPPVAAMAGDTWNFQAWYRDMGNTNNFTDAVSLTFQ